MKKDNVLSRKDLLKVFFRLFKPRRKAARAILVVKDVNTVKILPPHWRE